MEEALYYTVLGLMAKYPGDTRKVARKIIDFCQILQSANVFDGGAGSGNFNHAGRLGEVGGSAPAKAANAGLNNVLTEEEAQTLLSSDWKETISQAIAKLPKAKNGRAYIEHKESGFKIDVYAKLPGETKKEILNKNISREGKIGTIWAAQNMSYLINCGKLGPLTPDIHDRKGVKGIRRINVPFLLQIENKIIPFSSVFTVREFEDGRNVLDTEVLETNKGKDLSLYAISAKIKGV